MGNLSIANLTRQSAPRLPYAKASALALPAWDISLVFVGDTRARALNERLRGKKYVPNVLSYEVGAKSGEVIICLAEAKRQAASFGMTHPSFVLHLFIHGLLHLKGERHGARMEQRERRLAAQVAVARSSARSTLSITHEATHRHRHRHRDLPGQARRRRGGG